MWFNPPFSQNVKTNIGELYFKLVKIKLKKNQFRKIFTLSTLKLNYSSMANLQSLIKQCNTEV